MKQNNMLAMILAGGRSVNVQSLEDAPACMT